jgi:hypothetical protein
MREDKIRQKLIADNPFAHLVLAYEEAKRESQAMTVEERMEDWLQTKQSGNGSGARGVVDFYVSPVSGALFRI